MNNKSKLILSLIVCIDIVLFVILGYVILRGSNFQILNPKGLIGLKERDLMTLAAILSAIVIAPVFFLTFLFSWKYRSSNKKAKYTPEWDHSVLGEIVWWGIPFLIILILAVITWKSTHELDPYQPLQSTAEPITIQVVALNWKWLFIYPEQKIATINFIQFPEKTPVNFQITADAPMNSFWIPQLGGQIYAMTGMSTKLHLIADQVGEFNGVSANFSGEGFAGMKFIAKASSRADFDQWVATVKQAPQSLTATTYTQLAQPSQNNPVLYYATVQQGLYNDIVNKFMAPMPSMKPMDMNMHGM